MSTTQNPFITVEWVCIWNIFCLIWSLFNNFFVFFFFLCLLNQAYELSTLTGTQVMLLVASETGHVYTFATRKLQPMITSEAGKQLIQTCLNSPDPPSGALTGDQRMSATGFEETELSYNIGDDDSKVRQLIYSHGHHHGHAHLGHPQPTHYGIDQSLMQPNYATGGQASPLSHTQSYVPPHAGHTHHVPHPHPHSAFKNWIRLCVRASEWVCASCVCNAVQRRVRSFSFPEHSIFRALLWPSIRPSVCPFFRLIVHLFSATNKSFRIAYWLWFVLLHLISVRMCVFFLSRFIDFPFHLIAHISQTNFPPRHKSYAIFSPC